MAQRESLKVGREGEELRIGGFFFFFWYIITEIRLAGQAITTITMVTCLVRDGKYVHGEFLYGSFFFFLECRLAILLVSLKARIGRRCEFYPKIAEGERLREKREKRKDVTERSRTEQTTTTTTTKKKKKPWNAIFRFTL